MNTIDITAVLKRAWSCRAAWTREQFESLLKRMADAGHGATVDWDCGAGENWGRLVQSGEMIGILCLRCPIAFIKQGVFAPTLNVEGVEFLVVPTMEAPQYAVDRSVLEELVGRKVSVNWEPSKCSIQDLWWATAS